MLEKILSEGQWAVLFGAGVSIDAPANLPSGMELTSSLLSHIIQEEKIELVKSYVYSETLGWQTGRLIRFEQLIEILYENYQSIEFLDFIKSHKSPNDNHYSIAKLSENGAILLTTNFDCLVEYAAHESGIKLSQAFFTNEYNNDFCLESNVLYKLHGSVFSLEHGFEIDSTETIRTTVSNIYSNGGWDKNNILSEFLRKVIQEYNLFIVGYSGMDDFDISPIIQSTKSNKKIIWVEHDCSGKGISVFGINDLISEQNTKSRKILQSMVSLNMRSIEHVHIVQGDTNEILKVASRNTNTAIQGVSDKSKYLSYIDDWFNRSSSEKDRLHITTHILARIWEPEEALTLYEKHFNLDDLEPNDVQDEKLIVNYANVLAQILFKEQDITDASPKDIPDTVIKLEDYFDVVSSKRYRSNLANNLALSYLALNRKDKACYWLNQAISGAEKAKDLVIPLINLASSCKEVDEGLDILMNRVLVIAEKYNLIEYYPTIYSNIRHLLSRISYDNNKNEIEKYDRLVLYYSALLGNYPLFYKTISTVGLSPSDARRYKDILVNEKVVERNLNDVEKMQYYFSLSNIYSAFDVERELWCMEKSLAILNEISTPPNHDVASIIFSVSDRYRQASNITRSIEIADRACQYLEPDNVEEIHVQLALLKAKLHLSKGDIDESNKYYSVAKRALIQIKKPHLSSLLVDFYYDTRQYDSAITLAADVLPLIEDLEVKLVVLELVGNCYFNLRNYQESKKYYLQVLAKAYALPDAAIGAVLFNLSRIERKDGEYLSAIILGELSKLFGCHDKELIVDNEISKSVAEVSHGTYDAVINAIKIINTESSGLRQYLHEAVSIMSKGGRLCIKILR